MSPAGYPQAPPPRPPIPVTLSTASVYPEDVEAAFATAARHGYDGLEVMVTADPVTRSADRLAELIDRHGIRVTSVHSPCLLVTSRVWSADPLVKISRSVELAERIGADVVVAHPPFVWQRAAAADFAASVAELQSRTGVRIAVENMFPMTIGRGRITVNAYRPHWNPLPSQYANYTLDLSHTAASGVDALAMAEQMGTALTHVHLADGTGAAKDEHLVPGRGTQPCVQLLERLAAGGYTGAVCVEISTRGLSRRRRDDDVARSLQFARLALDVR